MTFLAPALLAGLLAVAIPVVLHLVQRERRVLVEFPSLMFLQKIPYQSTRRRAIRHWLLLALRVLAFALMALAFARPFLPGTALVASDAGAGRDVVILLDRSYSMGHAGTWDRARDAARGAIRALGPTDRATIVLFDGEVEVGPPFTSEKSALTTAVDRAQPGSGTTRYIPALRAASGLIAPSERPRREIVLISDFQKTGWDRSQDVRLPPGVVLTPVAVAEERRVNVAIVGLTIEREQGDRERVRLSARVANRSAEPTGERDMRLDVDGRQAGSVRVSLEPNASATVTYAPFALAGERVAVTARLVPGDALPRDDAFHAVLTGASRIPVLLIESPNPAPDSNTYLLRALGVGSSPGFATRVLDVARVTPSDISSAAAIVLNDSRPPAGAAAPALETAVRNGVGLLVALGERAAWPETGPDLLPGQLGGTTDRSGTRGGTLGFIDFSHPVFEIFSRPRSGDLTAGRMLRYRQFSASGATLARFDDGAIALAERRVGRGTVLVWTTTFDSYWNDLALKPVFVPFLHQAIRHLAHYVEPKPWYTSGEAFDPGARTGTEATIQDEMGTFVVIGPDGESRTFERTADTRALPLVDQGFYQIRRPDTGAGQPALVAVNVEPGESDLALMDQAELVSAVTAAGETDARASVEEMTVEERERRQAMWWYLLAAGLLLLVAEVVLANRMPRMA
ncbi:MAG: BatA domain-containing protein [Acidobacteriota bacterium]